MVSGPVVTFLVMVFCAPGECVAAHVPLPNLTLEQCFAGSPGIPADTLRVWQDAVGPRFLPALAWCERDNARAAYREVCAVPAADTGKGRLVDEARAAAHRCVEGRTILDEKTQPGRGDQRTAGLRRVLR